MTLQQFHFGGFIERRGPQIGDLYIMARARTRILPDGSVINDDDDESNNDSSGSSSNGGGGGRGGSRYCQLLPPRRIDLFGFNLDIKHFALIMLFVVVTMGGVGLGLFLSLLVLYTYHQRRSSSSSSGGGGGNSRWKDGKAVGTNIKGVGDLPKPKSG